MTSNGTNPLWAEDHKYVVSFYPKTVENAAKSKAEGRPIHDAQDWIKMFMPGDKTSETDRPVKEVDKERFKARWQAYLEKRTIATEGTALESWPILGVAQIADLKAIGISTVDQLANVTDEGLRNLGMGARTLRQKAIDFIAAAKSSAPLVQMREQIEELQRRLQQRDSQVEAMARKLEELTGEDSSVPATEPELLAPLATTKKSAKKKKEEISIGVS